MDRRVDVSRDLEGPLLDLGWCWSGQNQGRQKSDKKYDAESRHVEINADRQPTEKKVEVGWGRRGGEGKKKEEKSKQVLSREERKDSAWR